MSSPHKDLDVIDKEACEVQHEHYGASPSETAELSELTDEEKKLVRKIVWKTDARMFVCLCAMYIMNYVDRGNVAAARLKGLSQDTHLSSLEYSNVISLLYVTYVLFQVPSNIYINRIKRPSYYIVACMIVWGVISGLTALVTSYGGLVAIRLCLGAVESIFYPGALYLLSCWYTRNELALRCALLYGAALVGNAFGSLFAAGILKGLEGRQGIRGWRWLFIIEGVMTVFVALIVLPFLPDRPATARFLNDQEKALAVKRLTLDAGEADVDDLDMKWYEGAMLAFKDPKVWLHTGLHWAYTAALSFSNYFPTLVGTLGYSTTQTLLITAAPFLFALIVAYTMAFNSDRTHDKAYHIIFACVIGSVGCIIPLATTKLAARFVALFLLCFGYGGFVISQSWVASTIARPPAKRAVALAWFNGSTNLANLAGSYFFVSSRYGPTYRTSFGIILAMYAATILGAFITRVYLSRLNRKIDQAETHRGNVALNERDAVKARTGKRYYL